jgi:preprotein translocase subunit SecA
MTITQTIEISASRQITLDIPREVPEGRARVIIQFPVHEEVIPPDTRGQINNESFRNTLRHAYGAWQDNPWENHVEDVNIIRDEWAHRDLWNTNPFIKHQN